MIWMKFWVTNNVITDQAQYVVVTAIKMVLRSAASSTDMITAPLKGKKCAVALVLFGLFSALLSGSSQAR